MRHATSFTLAAFAAVLSASTTLSPAWAADKVLSGAVASAAGEKLSGILVSAKPVGGTITTSVYTDASGAYYFPPLPAGKYRVWAQALTFATAKGEVDLDASSKRDFALSTLADVARQLPGDLMLASLPDATPNDARLKQIIANNCTGCHTPSYPLQHQFDAAGWSHIIDLMKHVNVSGVYQGPDKTNGVLNFNQKELAEYLGRARGPGASGLNIKLRERPTGEAARVVYREYDVPLQDDAGLPSTAPLNDGSDWSQGTPSRLGSLVHDGWADLDGNLWFTSNTPNHKTSVGRIDKTTGEVKMIRISGQNGYAANTHGMTRDPNGILWFNANTGKGGLGRVDPKTMEVQVYTPPKDMSPTGGATTVDWDGKGQIWASSPDGVLRFDPKAEKFTEFKSMTYKTPNGNGLTYGAAGDRDGNGWWAEMIIDTIGKADSATGKVSEVKLPRVLVDKDQMNDDQRSFYENFNEPDFNAPVPWNQGPRRMGTDKAADILYVGDSWGRNLARIDTHTQETTFIPLPGPGLLQPYHVAVDSNHNTWLNIWTSDVIMKYEPASKKWTTFELPTRGTEARYISLLEKDGNLEVVLPYSRASKLLAMTFRSEADMTAAKAAAN